MILYLLLVLGFLICYIGLNIFLVKKSIYHFKELKKAYMEYKEVKNILFSTVKNKLDNAR
jgi:hypothetical protein